MAAAIIRQAVLLVVTPQCFEEFFTEMNFFHGEPIILNAITFIFFI